MKTELDRTSKSDNYFFKRLMNRTVFMTKFLTAQRIASLIIIAASVLLTPHDIRAQETAACKDKNIFFITSPLAGYSSVEGTIYDVLPVGYERAVGERAGIRVDSTLLYYDSASQVFLMKVGVPIYANTCSADGNYNGFYGAPLMAIVEDHRSDHTRRDIRGGFEAGYAWSVGNSMQLMLGYWHIVEATSSRRTGSGLTLALGSWF